MKLVMQAHVDQKLVTMLQVDTPDSPLGEYNLEHLCGEFIATLLQYFEREVDRGTGESRPQAD
jgi:hypothetical protein